MNSKNKQKLLVICGPTSTGKTDLGIYLSKKFNGEIISADSRQVYKNMNIGTGKEYSDEVKIWGYDLVSPNEDFSVSHFINYATQKISDISKDGKLPILVGGTGLYIKGVLEDFETKVIPPNEKLRSELSMESAEALFEKLLIINKEKALSLNNSDKKNPRRLIRAIEVATSLDKESVSADPKYDYLLIGLISDLPYLYERIENSVKKRLENGFVEEVKNLLKEVSINAKSMSATGYQEIANSIGGEISEEEAIKEWISSEKKYVKRQLTWFKKEKNINWVDIKEDYKEKVAEMVKTWENN